MKPEKERAALRRPSHITLGGGDSGTDYTTFAASRNCQHCGQHSQFPVCSTCRRWIRIYRHHVAANGVFREVGYVCH